jgi:GMP synthase (glutamine-hydrolysing)
MILFVAMYESEEDLVNPANKLGRNALRFEELSGQPCLVQRYREVNPEFMSHFPFTALLISGFGQDFDSMDLPALYGLYDVLHATELPVLGLCGGHQLIAKAFSSDFRTVEKLEDEPMRELREGEPDFSPGYHPGWYKEIGMQPIRVLEPADPLFAGLPETLFMLESHYCEVRALPPGFTLLATSDNCRVQALRHPTRTLYGTQFHPEAYTDYYTHGQQLLRNFFALRSAPEA